MASTTLSIPGTDSLTQQLLADVVLLRTEMKTCSTQVTRLAKEFDEFKEVVEAAKSEVDATRLIVIELTNKLKDL